MIEILKHGKNKYHFVCEKCGCEFCSDGEEIVSTKSIPVTRYILCPECENKINIENLDEHDDDKNIDISPLPPELIEKIFDKKYYDFYGDVQKYNKCERCLYYQSIKNSDCLSPIVGDTPCTFCQNNLPMCR